MDKIAFHWVHFIGIFGMATYSPGRRLIESYVYLVVSGGTPIDRMITHGCKKFEEKKQDMAGREEQEVNKKANRMADGKSSAAEVTVNEISVVQSNQPYPVEYWGP